MNSRNIAKTYSQIWINELLFWLHVSVIVAGILMGLVFPLYIILVIVLLHRFHLQIFNGCAISNYQVSKNGIHKSENFLQHMIYRFTGTKLTARRTNIMDYAFASSSIVVAFLAQKSNYREVIVCIVSYLFIVWGLHACYRIYASNKTTLGGTCQLNKDCSMVKNSKYAQIMGLPVEYLGFGYFSFLLFAEPIMKVLGIHHTVFPYYVLSIFIAGFVSLVFIYLQFAVLKNICLLCMNVHGVNLLLVLFTAYRLLNL